MADQQDERYYQALLEHRQLSRRALFRSLLKGGQKAYQQSEQQAVQRPVARPPQAVAEPLFMHLCNRCGECVAACPYGLLRIGEHKVSLNIDFSGCDMCGKCTDVCQTGALSATQPKDTALRPQISHLCLKQRNQYCHQCESHCAEQALSFNSTLNKLEVDPKRCNGCGECQVQCPYGYVELVL